MGLLSMDENSFKLRFSDLADNISYNIYFSCSPSRQGEAYEYVSRIEAAINNIPEKSPAPRHIKKVLKDILGIDVKISKKTTFGSTVITVKDEWIGGKCSLLWRQPELHIPVKEGMMLDVFRITYKIRDMR